MARKRRSRNRRKVLDTVVRLPIIVLLPGCATAFPGRGARDLLARNGCGLSCVRRLHGLRVACIHGRARADAVERRGLTSSTGPCQPTCGRDINLT